MWTAGFNNFLPIINYTIEYSTSFNTDQWLFLYQTPNNNTMVSGVPLSPWVNYKFRVKALNQKGVSEPSEPTNVCKTDPKRPARNPEGVRITDEKEGFLHVSWEVRSYRSERERERERESYVCFYYLVRMILMFLSGLPSYEVDITHGGKPDKNISIILTK